MVDLFKAETVNSDILIDEKMSIVTADENFEAISGNNALFVYTRYIHPDDVSRFTEALKDYAESGKFIVVRMLYQTGEYHWMLTRITDGGVSETRGHMYDINIMDAALITTQIDNLNSQIERYSSYLGMCENVLFSYDILNDDFNVFMTSDGHQTLSFYRGTLNAWEEDKIKIDALGLNEVKELDGFCKALANGEKLFKREITINILNKPGRLDRCLARGNTIVDAYGNSIVIGTIIILESSDNHVVEELNIISDMKDPGTDLLNKRAITDYVRKLIDSQPGHTVTIAIIDIDDFKTINDTYGHMFGDEVLCKVVDILRDAVGSRGLCGRIGGDEMFIIMEGLNDNEGIRNVLRTIRNNTKWLYHDDPRNIKITCSIGSATYPNDAKNYDELFKIADKVLYLAKEKGKDRYIIYHEDIHREYVYGMGRIVDLNDKVFYKYHKMEIVNTIIREYKEADDARRKELIDNVAVAFNINTIAIYDRTELTKHILYGDQRMTDDDGSFFKEDNYIPNFREDGIFVIDNINYFETKAPAVYKVYSEYGIVQAVQYIIGGDIKKNNNIISYGRFKLDKKWAESDMNFLAIIGDYIGRVFLKERKHD